MFSWPAHRRKSHGRHPQMHQMCLFHVKQHRCALAPPLYWCKTLALEVYGCYPRFCLKWSLFMFQIHNTSFFFSNLLYICDREAKPWSQQPQRCVQNNSSMEITKFCFVPIRVLLKSWPFSTPKNGTECCQIFSEYEKWWFFYFSPRIGKKMCTPHWTCLAVPCSHACCDEGFRSPAGTWSCLHCTPTPLSLDTLANAIVRLGHCIKLLLPPWSILTPRFRRQRKQNRNFCHHLWAWGPGDHKRVYTLATLSFHKKAVRRVRPPSGQDVFSLKKIIPPSWQFV